MMETAMNQMPKGEIAPRLLTQLSSADEVIDSAGPILRQYLAEPDRFGRADPAPVSGRAGSFALR